MHMHVPTKLHQHVFTGEVGRKSTRGGKGRGTSEWYFGWLAKKPFHLEKTMQHTSWAAIMIWSKCTITPGSWQHSRPEHTRMPCMPTMTTETRTSKAMFTLYWIPFYADTRSYLVWYEQQRRHRAGTSRSTTSKIVKERLVERVWWTKSQYSHSWSLLPSQWVPALAHFRYVLTYKQKPSPVWFWCRRKSCPA